MTYVVPTLEIAGPEQHLVKLVNSLDRRNFQAAIVCVGADPDLIGQVAGHVRVRCLPVRWTGRGRSLLKWPRLGLLAFTVALDLALRRPDMVHAYVPAGNVLGGLVARLLGVRPVVCTRMTVTRVADSPSRALRLLANPTNRLIDLQVCDSEAARRMVLATERVDPGRIVVIHSGTPLPDLSVDPPPVPASWGLKSEELAAVCLASLTWRKAHGVLMRAVATVARTRPGFRLVLVGEGEERPQIEGMVEELGIARNVVLAGSVAEASRLLRHFKFSVLSSVEESFPNALVESMAAGIPVVATRVGGVPELVRDRLDGLMVPAGDSHALAGAMLELLAKPELAARMGRSARKRASELFSIERMAGEFEGMYAGLLGSAPDLEGSQG